MEYSPKPDFKLSNKIFKFNSFSITDYSFFVYPVRNYLN